MKQTLPITLFSMLCLTMVLISCMSPDTLSRLASVERTPKDLKRTYYADGRKKTEAYYEGDKLNGVFKEFDEKGRLKFEKNYKNDILEGASKEYYSNGKLKELIMYRNGKIETLKLYREDGRPVLVDREW